MNSNMRIYLHRLYREFSQKYAAPFLFVILAAWIFNQHYALGINVSYSLPHHLYLIKKDDDNISNLKQGDFVAFSWQGGFYPVGTQMIKEVAGLPGDVVSRKDRTFFINGKAAGTAKKYSMSGDGLEINPFEGKIPEHFMWMKSDHKDSLDSRYKLSGLIHSGQIVGKAVPIF